MKKKLLAVGWLSLAVVVSGCVVGGSPGASGDAPAGTDDAAVRHAMERVFPALIRIHVVAEQHGEGRQQRFEAAGSGVIISPDGYAVTNHHVAGNARWIRCTLANKDEADAVLVGTDALADIAVIKLDPKTLKKPVAAFPCAAFGDSSKLRVGDRVLAMGSPLALSQSVTLGIVSNVEMVMPEIWWGYGGFKLDGEEVGTIVRWIAHDAAIYGGNSGGPLSDGQGRIVGINEIGFGLSGAIPGNLARDVARHLIERGHVPRSWIGVEVRPVLRSAGADSGVLVNGVMKGSPAEKGGVKPGDLILAYDGDPVVVRWAEELPAFNRTVLETPVGKTVKLDLLRDGKPATARVTTEAYVVTAARGRAREEDTEFKEWGATFRNISFLAAKELRRETRDGALVSSLRPGGPCGQAKPAIGPGDIVVEVAGKPVTDLAALRIETDRIAQGKAEPVPTVVAFARKSQRLLTVVKIGPSEKEDRSPEVRKAWFPASVQVFTRDLAEAMGLAGKKGVLITQLYPGQAAEKAGFKLGDILTDVDGTQIDATHPEDDRVFPEMIRRYRVGTSVEVSVIRDGGAERERKDVKISIELPQAPVPVREMKRYKDLRFEFTARDLAFLDRTEAGAGGEQGVYVDAVEGGSWAALAHMAVGDILLSVGERPVKDAAALEEIMKGIVQGRPRHVVFFVRRGIHTMFLELEPDWGAK